MWPKEAPRGERMQAYRILIVEDDANMREALQYVLQKEGHRVDAAESGEGALGSMKDTEYALVITDLKLPGMDGMDVLRAIKQYRPEVVVIVLTAYGTIDSAVVAMKAGAEDYITKPFNIDHIRLVVKKALEKRELSHRTVLLESQLRKKYRFENIIGNSEAMIKVYKIIERIKDSKATVLLRGETGSGKELVARAIHFNSVRSAHPFVPVNCAALGENLAGSELFGHVKGSFTGAFRDKRGIFEVAEGGTIFLDEIGNIGLGLQQVFLRVLEAGELQPVGSVERKKVSVRIVAATNKNLEQMVKDNAFREDLYYRISVVVVDLPSLRERKEDIGVLARHFLEKYARENSRRVPAISADALHLLEAYGWPGNVRELENVMERAVLLTEGEVVLPESLPPHMQDLLQRKNDGVSPDLSLERVGRNHIVSVLKAAEGNRAKASQMLGINRTTLWRMMQRLDIADKEFRSP